MEEFRIKGSLFMKDSTIIFSPLRQHSTLLINELIKEEAENQSLSQCVLDIKLFNPKTSHIKKYKNHIGTKNPIIQTRMISFSELSSGDIFAFYNHLFICTNATGNTKTVKECGTGKLFKEVLKQDLKFSTKEINSIRIKENDVKVLLFDSTSIMDVAFNGYIH